MMNPCTDCGKMAKLTSTDLGEVCEKCLANYMKCSCCDEYCSKDDGEDGPNGWLCQVCFDDTYCHCDRCHDVIEWSETSESPDGDRYCPHCFSEHCQTCNQCGYTMWRYNIWYDPNGIPICGDCFDDSCFACEGCGETCWSDDGCGPDGNLCANCAEQESPTEFPGREEYTRIGKRRYGVEIETDTCEGHLTPSNFVSKYDGSIRGREFASRVLYGDAGLEAIEALCTYAKKNHWTVDHRCGLHIHLDMSKEKTKALKAAALAYVLTYEVWKELVEPDRAGNTYCQPCYANLTRIKAIKKFTEFAQNQTRYEWANFAAYAKFKTFEIRLHQGSLDATEICNWLRIHTIFMDWATSMSFTKVKNRLLHLDTNARFEFIMDLCEQAGQSDLVNYYQAIRATELVTA